MLTPQDVSTHVFAKAHMGGYNMAMVDDFLDELTEDYTTLYKENAALKAKMKVLVDKIEEYRATEDSMRATLLSAQRMADQMVEEAKQKKAAMLKEAEGAVADHSRQLQRQIDVETQRLNAAKQESAAFIAQMRKICTSELEFLEEVPNLEIPEPEPVPPTQAEQVEEKAEAIENSIRDAVDEEISADAPAQETAPQDDVGEPTQDLEATRRIDLKDLKFGSNGPKYKDEKSESPQ